MLSDYLSKHPDVVYLYAGGIVDAEYQQSIIEYAKKKGISDQVKYVGELAPGEQLNAYYNMADCCVFTSTLESFGLVIIESIASGTPVVLSGNLMFALNCGYYMYHTRKEFVTLVDKALSQGKLSREEYREVLDEYSWDTVAGTHSALFQANK
jgi:glycosyltransferase involved in cell wall biosynthesis